MCRLVTVASFDQRLSFLACPLRLGPWAPPLPMLVLSMDRAHILALKHRCTQQRLVTHWFTVVFTPQGPDNMALMAYLKYKRKLHIVVLWDIIHETVNSVDRALQKCGLLPVVNEIILAWKLPWGPWSGLGFHAKICTAADAFSKAAQGCCNSWLLWLGEKAKHSVGMWHQVYEHTVSRQKLVLSSGCVFFTFYVAGGHRAGRQEPAQHSLALEGHQVKSDTISICTVYVSSVSFLHLSL